MSEIELNKLKRKANAKVVLHFEMFEMSVDICWERNEVKRYMKNCNAFARRSCNDEEQIRSQLLW